MDSCRRKAKQVVEASGVPTLHRVVTTADELRNYLDDRATHIAMNEVEPSVLQDFLWQSHARA